MAWLLHVSGGGGDDLREEGRQLEMKDVDERDEVNEVCGAG